MNELTLKNIFKKTPLASEYFRQYSRYLLHLLANLDFEIIENVADLILTKAKEGRAVFLIGNGGSATTASHFATDLSHCGFIKHRPIIKAISLTENIAMLTALGNDKGYDQIFASQIKNLFQPEDILIAISASGNSPNLIAAIKQAQKMGGHTIGLVGFNGGEMGKICEHVIQVQTEQGEYGPVEDLHIILDHMLTSYLGIKLKNGNATKRRRSVS